MKDSAFYNQESGKYSEKRYPRIAQTYTQFFFKRRLAITQSFLARIIHEDSKPLSLLEVGCADGVVIRAIADRFPHAFSDLIGIDIAEGMIEEAHKKNTVPNASFYTRAAYQRAPVDVIVETGVANYAKVDEELAFALANLTPGGSYILTLAGTGSLYNRIKHDNGFNDFRSYDVYEKLITEQFTVCMVRGCGLFIPYMWRVPLVARMIQAVFELIASVLTPGICHEKVYLLKKK